MVEFKVILANPKNGNSYKIELKNEDANKLLGYKIGDQISGSLIGLNDEFDVSITGGSDKSGFAMRKDLQGANKRKILSATGLGFKTKISGKRKRKYVRGNEISQDIIQVNAKVVKYGTKSINEFFNQEKE